MKAPKYLPMIHPGEILLEEFIRPMGLTLATVSRATGIPASRLTEITAAFWIGLQSEHDLEEAERSYGKQINREVISIST